MDSDNIACYIEKHDDEYLLVSFYNKSPGIRVDTTKALKLASAEFKNISESTLETLFYCIDQKNKSERDDLLKLYENKKIVELCRYKAHQSYFEDEKIGIPKCIIRAFLPILKLTGYKTFVIKTKIYKTKVYETIGMKSLNDYPYPDFIVDIVDALAKIPNKNIKKMLKDSKSSLKLKETMIEEWISSNKDTEKNNIFFMGDIETVKNTLYS